jgi:UDP-glucuronate 4-epimerase
VKALVTGSAGFIGYHVVRRLLADGYQVLGIDGMTDYYDPALKRARLDQLAGASGFAQIEAMLEDAPLVREAVAGFAPDIVVHLAAQAGVRQSLEHPEIYASANVIGTMNLLEALRRTPPRHLLFASTSSIYGGSTDMPFRETRGTDFPVSLYAATKKAGEALTHAYAHLYRIPVTCFRFFTVYGPWGRPDMAYFKFADAITAGRSIDIYGQGNMQRDFTYIDDLVEAVRRLIDVVPGESPVPPGTEDSLSPVAPWRAVNIARGEPVVLLDFIAFIERGIGRPAIRQMLPMQPGDVSATWADASLLNALTGYVPDTSPETGVPSFIDWHRTWTARNRR